MLYNTNAAKGATRNPSRRTFLKIAPAAAVAAAAAEANASPAAITPELAELIARYCQINDRENSAREAISRIEDSEEFERRGHIKLIEVVRDASEYPRRLLHVAVGSERAIEEFFENVNGMVHAVTRISNHPVFGMSDAEARIRMSRADDFHRAMELLKQRKAEKEQWLQSIGWEALQDLANSRDGSLGETLKVLLAFPCQSYADAVAKAEWAAERLDEEWPSEELFILIKSMIPARPDNQPLHA